MREITMFVQNGCPHCALAKRYLGELLAENKAYGDLRITEVDELAQKELAAMYDYWYVPSFFIGGEKVHEGHAEYQDVKGVLDTALGVWPWQYS